MSTARYLFKIEQQTPLAEGERYNSGKSVIDVYYELDYSAVLRIIQGINNEAIAENSKQITQSASIRATEIREDSVSGPTLGSL